jgi:hypothetical protein
MDPESSPAASFQEALHRGCRMIRISGGEWDFADPLLFENVTEPVLIRGEGVAPVFSGRSPLIVIRQSKGITLENLVLEGDVEMDQTEDIAFRDILFRRSGVRLTGKRCNQPNECTSFNRRVLIEDCIFENSSRGIFAERIEHATIQRNRFIGSPAACSPESVGIELDGSSEDLDRPLELGHNKGNQVLQNSFERESAIGIRVRDSWANLIRDNRFVRSYRAMEFQGGARHNQILQSYIGYLSQQPSSGACPAPCAIYLGPGSVNNIFTNNFFEQSFELQYLETSRNRTFVIDESGNQNTFRSDFLRINR